MTGDEKRGRGIFSPADRQFIANPEEYSRQATHERERAIRDRLYNAIFDFALLADLDPSRRSELLRYDQLESATQPDVDDWPTGRPDEVDIKAGMENMLVFAHHVLSDLGAGAEPNQSGAPEGHKSRTFERKLRSALRRAYREDNLALQDLNLEIESDEIPGLHDIESRVSRGAPVDPIAVGHFIQHGDIDSTAYYEFLAEQLDVDLPTADDPLFSGDDGS